MRSKTSFCNKTLFVKNITRFWPLWAAYALGWLLLVPVQCWQQAAYMRGAGAHPDLFNFQGFLEDALCTHLGPVLIFGGSALAACMVFSHLYNARLAGMIGSLPVSREAQFGSSYLAGLVMLLAAPLLAMVLTLPVLFLTGVEVGAILALAGKTLLVLFIETVLLYGLTVLCAQFTGHAAVLLALILILNFVAVVVEFLVRGLMNMMLYGLSGNNSIVLGAFSPLYWIFTRRYTDYIFSVFFPMFAVYAIAGIAFAVAALFLYKRRQLETASEVIAVRPLKPVFKYCMTFGCALVLGMLLYFILSGWGYGVDDGNLPLMLGCMVFGGSIGYFGSEMLLRKSFRVFRAGWKGFAVSLVVILLFMAGLGLDVFGIVSRVPKTEEIAAVHMAGTILREPENIERVRQIHQQILDRRDEREEADGQSWDWVYLNYELENGNTLSREYPYWNHKENLGREGTLETLLKELYTSPEWGLSRYGLNREGKVLGGTVHGYTDDGDYDENSRVELTSSETEKLLKECVIPDVTENGVFAWDRDDWYDSSEYALEFPQRVYELEWNVKKDGDVYTNYLHVAPEDYDTRTGKYILSQVKQAKK